MPRILLLYTDADFYSELRYDERWREALEAEGCELVVAPRLEAIPDGPWDLVIPHVLIEEVTSFAPTFRAAALLETGGTPMLNSLRSIVVSSDKWLTHALWEAAGISQPATWQLDGLDAWPGEDGRPLVLKPALGEAGRDAELVHDLDAAHRLAREWKALEERDGKPRGNALLQAWIEEPEVVRLYATPEEAQSSAYVKERDHGELVSEGAYVPVDCPPEIAALARRMVQTLGGGLMGVDVLVDGDGRAWALEANAAFAFAPLDPAQPRFCARMARAAAS